MKKSSVLTLILLSVSSYAFGQNGFGRTQSTAQNKWKSFSDKGYTIQYPGNWDMDTTQQMGTSFIIFSKPTGPDDHFRENVNLLIQDLSGKNINLDKYVKISEEQIKTAIVNGKLLNSKRYTSANGRQYQKVIFLGDQGMFKLKFEQYYFVERGKAYVLTLTCEADKFDSYKETGEKILNSFSMR